MRLIKMKEIYKFSNVQQQTNMLNFDNMDMPLEHTLWL